MTSIYGLARLEALRRATRPSRREVRVLWTSLLVEVPAPPGRWSLRLVKRSRRLATPPLAERVRAPARQRARAANAPHPGPSTHLSPGCVPCARREGSPVRL